jgi:putative hemolysin
MRRSGSLVLRLFGARDARRGGAVHSPDELKLIVTASRQFGQIPESQEEMIHNAIELDSITVREVMVARPDIFSLPSTSLLDEALNRVVEGQHSRIPVYDPQRGPEHIVGVLYYKDLVRWVRLRLINLGQPLASRIARMQSARSCTMCWSFPKPKCWRNCWPNSKSAAATSPWWSTSSARPQA